MLHEIILSLSGHASPLLSANASNPSSSLLSPPEKALLATVASLSEKHRKIRSAADKISTESKSSICQSVATAISSKCLGDFQRKVLEVESGILRKDASSVGAYNIVPLTAVVGEFSEWTRLMDWLLRITQLMMEDGCTGSRLINKLNKQLQTGYTDIEEAALHLGQVAESAWLRQASCWILYGRLPSYGHNDFFLQEEKGRYEINQDLLPHFVSPSTAKSITFIGKSLHQIRTKSETSASCISALLPKHLQLLSSMQHPITSSSMSNTVSAIRKNLSQTALQDLLPLSKIQEVLRIFYDFFLLNRGEFAIALVNEADERIRSRWQRSDNLAYEKRDKLSDVVVKDGEVTAVLARIWTSMFGLHGITDEDEDELEMARDMISLSIEKAGKSAFLTTASTAMFHTTLLSVPTALSLKISSPLDLFLSQKEVEIYSSINAYLLSIRRAHLRLSDLWKITSLRRHHPAPPAPPFGSIPQCKTITVKLRTRAETRSAQMRNVWATSSSALYVLGELAAYFQGEVVNVTWEDFQHWISGTEPTLASRPSTRASKRKSPHDEEDSDASMHSDDEPTPKLENTHDPQTLSAAHQRYLLSLKHQLLLTAPAFTDSLFKLLQKIDLVVALVHRIHAVWMSMDLEADGGKVDAFSDHRKEEHEIGTQLSRATMDVKGGISNLVSILRLIDQDAEGREHALEQLESQIEDFVLTDDKKFRPKKVGRVDRLLMKLDFGGWIEPQKVAENESSDEEIL